MNSKKVLIVTALPFREKGNQSLFRFVNMFLHNDVEVKLLHDEVDSRGNHVISNPNFSIRKFVSFREPVFNLFKFMVIFFTLNNNNKVEIHSPVLLDSDLALPPFGCHSNKTLVVKWVKFLLCLFDNVIAFIYILLFHFRYVQECDAIIGYEVDYSFCAKFLSCIFYKKYINKYQGVTLHASARDISQCIKYYPLNFFGIHKSDLCIMVNDGTDGYFYAKERGCENILFESHGVDQLGYPEYIAKNQRDKLVVVNLASGSCWKRVDRFINVAKRIPNNYRDKVEFITTYFGEGYADLIAEVKNNKLEDFVRFAEGLDHLQANELLRQSDILFMTNDLSNLGNPVLEAIFYGIPILTVDDGSCVSVLNDSWDSKLVKLEGFDKECSEFIISLINNEKLLATLTKNMHYNSNVKTLVSAQGHEFAKIRQVLFKEDE